MDYHSDEACSFWHDFSEWSWRAGVVGGDRPFCHFLISLSVAATINNLNIDDVVVNYDEDAGNPATLGRLWCSWDNWCWVYMKNITYNSVPSRFSEEVCGGLWCVLFAACDIETHRADSSDLDRNGCVMLPSGPRVIWIQSVVALAYFITHLLQLS